MAVVADLVALRQASVRPDFVERPANHLRLGLVFGEFRSSGHPHLAVFSVEETEVSVVLGVVRSNHRSDKPSVRIVLFGLFLFDLEGEVLTLVVFDGEDRVASGDEFFAQHSDSP